MTLSSGTMIREGSSIYYSDIGINLPDQWIQESAIRLMLDQSIKIINNIYSQVEQAKMINLFGEELNQEFAAWDAASDEALLNFEQEIS